MDVNPFTEQLNAAEKRASCLSQDLQDVRQDIEWYEATDRETLCKKLDSLQSYAAHQRREVYRARHTTKKLESELRSVSSSINSLVNPKNWFDSRQRQFREQAKKLKAALTKAQEAELAAEQKDVRCQNGIKVQEDEIERYDAFDFDSKNLERSELAKALSKQKLQVGQISAQKNKVDAALDPILKQLREAHQKKADALAMKQRAQKLDNELSTAENSYERAMAHKECEKEFGVGSPRKVIDKKNGEIERLDRDIEKLHKRASRVGKNAARLVRQLILDGNNLCYEGGEFIGLGAVNALVSVLSGSYEVIVVFDATIRKNLQSSDSAIRSTFGEGVKVHVVATGGKADETVLELAGADESTFVISNDRFAEFQDKSAVKNERLIRHEIVGGRILIHDLGISETYSGSDHDGGI